MSALTILDSTDVDVQIGRIREAIELLETLDGPAVLDAVDKAGKFRSVAKAMKANERLIKECILFEVHALRAVARLGMADSLPPSQRNPARALLDEDVFQAVVAKVDRSATAVGAYRAYVREVEAERFGYEVDAWRFGAGREVDRLDVRDVQDIAKAAAALLDRIDVSDHGWTISHLAEEIRDSLGRPSWSSLECEAVKEIVREALVADAALGEDDAEKLDGLPRYVTFSVEGVWMRIPVREATINQLDQMLDLRRLQIAQMVAKTERLNTAVETLKSIQKRRPDALLVNELLRSVKQRRA